MPIVRHVKIREKATPFDPQFVDYFKRRDRHKKNLNPDQKLKHHTYQAQSKRVELAGLTDVGL